MFPYPPFPPYSRFPFPPRLGKAGTVLSAAAMLAYGAWRVLQNRKARKAGADEPATPQPEEGAFPREEAEPGCARQAADESTDAPTHGPQAQRPPQPDAPYPFGSMESAGGGRISLKSVSISGEVEGLLFSSTIRQEYANDTGKALEIIYTFPLGWDTALLGLQAVIGGRRLSGKVVKTAEAEETYEKAVADGNAAIMVQQSSQGLYTANLGNIAPGENVTVELHCARLLRFEQGQVRLCIPTVIGERYGDPHCPGGLAAHESARPDARARYPFALELTLWGDMAEDAVSCPSHEVQIRRLDAGLCVSLEAGAVLDRDFILLMRGLEGRSHALCVPDEDACLVAASFAPEIPQDTVAPLGLKILVDCSGSMSGSSMAEAQRGLGKVLSLLAPDDQVSYSRFGSGVKHLTRRLLPCTPENLVKLSQAVEATDADMGGTAMERALHSTFQDIACEARGDVPPFVLLITDGDVWDVQGIVAQAKTCGHRIFAVGVGCAPAESLLRDLAEQTGGACEFVSPSEDMAEAIVRMFRRMRGAMARHIRVNWGQEPLWQSRLPRAIYDGETVHAFALFSEQPASAPVLLWDAGAEPHSAACARLENTDSEDLLRLGRRRQMEEAASDAEKLALALRYQLLSGLTSLILVHERADGEKLEGLPVIQQVPQMPAYGHGCTDSFTMCHMVAPDMGCFGAPMRQRMLRRHFRPQRGLKLGDTGAPAKDEAQALAELVRIWEEKVFELASVEEMVALLRSAATPAQALLMAELERKFPLDAAQLAGVFLQWALNRVAGRIGRHPRRLINAALQGAAQADIEACTSKIEEWYTRP